MIVFQPVLLPSR